MNRIVKLIAIVTCVMAFMPLATVAQRGIVRGQIIEDATGEPLFSANAILKGTQSGATTDFDGKFEISAAPGTYELSMSFIGMSTTTITDVVVKAGDVTVIDVIRLKSSANQLAAVTITAKAARNTEEGLITVKKKSVNVIDGISAAKFKKIGDSNAGDAAKRVTGVSVEGGKYVYVRGLGDRYTKNTLNGVDVPGLDPDRNSLQIDIFPTSLINNMTVLKSASADLPADFTGGIVDIEIKSFPDKKILEVSGSAGYNPSMHFNKNYINYEGGKTDFLGFDDGTRKLPNGGDEVPIPNPLSSHSNSEVNTFLNEFNPVLGADQTTSMMDFGLGFSMGNQYALKNGNKLGYIFSATYKNETKFYDDVKYGEYFHNKFSDEYELIYSTTQEGIIGENNVLAGALGGLALKTLGSKYRFTVMHLQNGESRASQMRLDNNGSAPGQSGYFAYSNNLEYSQRGLTNILLNGEHFMDGGAWKIDWRVSPTFSKIVEPDIRKTAFTVASDSSFAAGAGGNPNRIWRYLEEVNATAKVDVTREYTLFDEEAKLKFGASHVFKHRDYEILSFDLKPFGAWPDYSGDPNKVLDPDQLYPNGAQLYYVSQSGNPNTNEYSSTVHNTGVYVSNEFEPFSRFKAVLGLRAEKFLQLHTGRSLNPPVTLDNDKVLDALDLFPSANLIYQLDENQNLRASYYRSIARPSFKELSFAQIIDPVTNRIFNGGLFTYPGEWDGNLTETRINNYDLRWEYFMKRGELVSVSVFYKTFDRPIELVRIYSQPTSSEFQPRNVGDGTVYGAEFEFRKSLGFIASALSNYSLNGNLTLVNSEIEMTDREYAARKVYEKDGENIEKVRDMAGQAPYILNAGFAYDNFEKGLNAGVYYNVQGKTLLIVGGGLFPDVYSEPFHSVNVSVNKTLGKEKNMSVSLKAFNLLNDVKESFYTGYKAQDQYFSSMAPGSSYSVGFSYKF